MSNKLTGGQVGLETFGELGLRSAAAFPARARPSLPDLSQLVLFLCVRALFRALEMTSCLKEVQSWGRCQGRINA